MRKLAGWMLAIWILCAGVVSAEEVVEIRDAEDWAALARRVGSGDKMAGVRVVLTQDIRPMGAVHAVGTARCPFEGTFEGGGHTIWGAVVSGGADCEGLFGCVGREGSVRNLRLEMCWAYGRRYTGALCGLSAGDIERCSMEKCRVWGFSGEEPSAGTGGLVGCLSADMTACSARESLIRGGANTGGLAGSLYRGTMMRCVFSGQVSGEGLLAGSLHAGSRLCFSEAEGEKSLCGRAEQAEVYACLARGGPEMPVRQPIRGTMMTALWRAKRRKRI